MLNFKLVLITIFSIVFNEKLLKVKAQPNVCSLASAILAPGKATISQQFNIGFCRDWIIGPVTRPQRILISFSNVDIDCEKDDKLWIYNEDKSYLLYDYCNLKKNKTDSNFVLAKAKYLVARMLTSSNRYLSATFDLVLLDAPVLVTLQQPSPLLILTSPMNNVMNPINFDPIREQDVTNDQICASNPTEIEDSFGTLNSPLLREGFSYNVNCSWIIKAPKNQRVYIVFDFINLPNNLDSRLDQFGCSSNYVSIASVSKPFEDYKLCGQRRGVKLITTYNNVLINFATRSLRNVAAGFSLIFRVIKDPNALVQTTTTSVPPLISNNVDLAPSLSCGLPFNKPLETIGRIIGGEESVPHSWPWQVMITDGLIMCGASLITNQWIVTAAHCTENINNGPIKAYLGMHNRLRSEPSKVIRYVDQVIVHPNYMGRLTQWDHDIALMKLQEPVNFSNDISPICLPPQDVNLATIGTKGYVTGWGDTQGTGPAYLLRQASITVRRNQDCGANSENMLCAGDKTPELHDSCQGDSGGPFFMKNSNNYYLVGIVSWGYDCNGAGVYTKVSNFVKWINSVTSSF